MARNIRLCVFGFQHKNCLTVVCSSLKRPSCSSAQSLPFVPVSEEANAAEVERLAEFVSQSKKLFVLTGAGISTESGIPDYRSEGVGLYATSTNRPVQYMDFLKNAEIRQRYWARNYVGWPRFSSFLPNEGHKILSNWERTGKISWWVLDILISFVSLHGRIT